MKSYTVTFALFCHNFLSYLGNCRIIASGSNGGDGVNTPDDLLRENRALRPFLRLQALLTPLTSVSSLGVGTDVTPLTYDSGGGKVTG